MSRPLAATLSRLRPAAAPDADLVRRFAADRDPLAFEALVRRHGPAVLGACHRVLGNAADAEDAFQATFLVFARKAGAVRRPAAVGSWLYGVAVNVSRRARDADRRRRRAERSVPIPVRPDALAESVVDAELARLPEPYRLAVLACADGLTREQAAESLGWPAGTVATRLHRGRAMLAERLARRGVLVPAVAVAVSEQLVQRSLAAPSAAAVSLSSEVSRAMLFAKLKLVVAGAVLATGVVLAIPPSVDRGQLVPAPAAKADPDAARKLLDKLRDLKPKKSQSLEDDTAPVLRDFCALGANAVPALIAELDTTDDGFMLRCLGFAARAIGDRRAVPALIRALPKTCQSGYSDYGNICNIPDVLKFLQKHQHPGPKDHSQYYDFGRPITEFRATLKVLTGTSHGEEELVHVGLEGTAAQRAAQRALYRRCAERWAVWWGDHWNEFVADPKYASVGLPPTPRPATDLGGFPRGPKVSEAGGAMNCLLRPAWFVDLDTGREAGLPERLRAAAGQSERLDEVAAWAAAEGFDLMGVEHTPPGGKPVFVIRGLGLTAWPAPLDRRGQVLADLKADRPLALGPPAGGLLAPFDAAAGRFRPADPGLFLFRTREGGHGWLVVGVEVHDTNMPVGLAAGGDMEMNPVHFHKGRRYAYSLLVNEASGGR